MNNTRIPFLCTLAVLLTLALGRTAAARTLASVAEPPSEPAAQTSEAVSTPDLPAADGGDSTALMTLSPTPMSVDSLERIDGVDTDLVSLRRSAEGDEVVLEVGGFGITLSSLSEEKIRDRDTRIKRPRLNLVALSKSEQGFLIPTGVDYGDYPAGTGEFFDLRSGKSYHFSTTLVGLSYDFGKRRQFSIETGLRYTVDNYRLSDNSITLGNSDGMVVPVTLDEKADKSKLRITSLGIPLHLTFSPIRHMNISLSGYFDFTMGVNSIYKHPKVKNPLSGVNPFQVGIGLGVSYYSIGVYVRYGITPLFKSGVGPQVRPLSIGFCYAM